MLLNGLSRWWLGAAADLEPPVPPPSVLRCGQTGPAVVELQRALCAAGFPLVADGIFGRRTLAALRLFQLERGLHLDGLAGPETLAALRAGHQVTDLDHHSRRAGILLRGGAEPKAPSIDALRQRPVNTLRPKQLSEASRAERPALSRVSRTTMTPDGSSEEERFRHYQRIIESAGGRVIPGERSVLALRSATGASKTMQDEFVVLHRDRAGQAHVENFVGSTHPAQRRSSISPDVDGDGQGDVGMLSEGNYRVTAKGHHNGAASFVVKTRAGSSQLPGTRDLDHDGRISEQERLGSARRGDQLSGVLFHRGNANGTARSIGCMNVQDWDGFVRSVGGPTANFEFTLVRADAS